jgi:Tfp pilus assembly protein PilF
LGYALLQKEQFPEALQMLDKALEVNPKCGEAHLSYANYYAYKQDWRNADQSANRAIK